MSQTTSSVEKLLLKAYADISRQHLLSATEALEEALAVDFDSYDVVTSLKYVNFWLDRQANGETMSEPYDRGEYYVGQWHAFQSFVARIGETVEPTFHALRQFVFREALTFYRDVYQERSNRDPDLLVRIGRCYKGTGEYDRALKFIQAASGEKPENPEILAELADVLALTNETAKAKALFREAFFLGANAIEVERLESEMIRRLSAAVDRAGHVGEARNEWIPVFGVLYGVLTVKRELRSIEFGRLKQAIYLLERELREGTGNETILVPRLINRYFWLLDHFAATGESQDKSDEVLLKIRSIDANVYHEYTK
jgi:tetratricopeptide (TPR) repeat protein